MKIGTRVVSAFAVLIVCFGIAGIIAVQNQERISKTKWWVEHTYMVLAKLDAIFGQLSNQESNVRGFVIMSDENIISEWTTFKSHL